MAYDTARQVIVLFGGFTGPSGGETWEWNGAIWTLRATTGPSPRESDAMAYDQAHGVTVLFGGYDGANNGETWVWDGLTWKLSATTGPSPRFGHKLAYDAGRGVVVLFGGFDGTSNSGETWEWNGTTWTLRHTYCNPGPNCPYPGPSPRSFHAMTYDAARGAVVLFGGSATAAGGETWEWNGTIWTLRATTGPSPRSGHALAYDSGRNVVVLFGGYDASGRDDQTWEWNGSSWTLRATGGPSPRWKHAVAYDAARGETVLFGGSDLVGAGGETWAWNGSTWTMRATTGPSPRYHHAAVYDAAQGVVLLFGGNDGNVDGETWAWNGSVWTLRTKIGPSAREEHALAYDSARNVTVLFGGHTGNFSKETWEWNGTAWALRATSGPSPRDGHALAYDGARGVVVLFGGYYYDMSAHRYGDTWTWNGSAWTQRASTGPAARDGHALAYDPVRQVVVLFGGRGTSGRLGDTWEWNGTTWTQRPGAGPTPRDGHAMAYDATQGVVVLHGGQDDSGLSAQTWEWNGATWALRAASGPSLRDRHAIAYDTARGALVLFGGWSLGGRNGETWELTLGGGGPTILTHPSSVVAVIGQSVQFTVQAAGIGPLSYQWRKNSVPLSNGGHIFGVTTSALTINPVGTGDAGFYDVVVTDDCGSVISAPAALTVGSGPTITQQPVSQSVCDGDMASFWVTAIGTGTLTYQWRKAGAPLTNGGNIYGATSFNLTINPAGPGDAGSYDVVITDNIGSVTSAPATLTVNTGPTIGQPPNSQIALVGGSATFTVTASGLPPMGYEWRKNGVPLTNGGNISGANTAMLVIDPVAMGDAGVYDVEVSDPCGSVISAGAVLTVNPGPNITQQPVNQTACLGGSASFTVTAVGTGTLTYQWRKSGVPLTNGGNISGATSPQLTINPVALSDAGSYDVVVTDSYGSATSDPATLSVKTGPTITQQPSNVTVPVGGTAVFTVVATVTPPVSYQWRKGGVPLSNGGNISGADTSTLKIQPVSGGDAGIYDVVVTDLCGSVTSAPRTLTVASSSVGDTNCDGAINAFDIDPFVLALVDPFEYALAFPDCNILNADCNGDGLVNAFDIDPFVVLLNP